MQAAAPSSHRNGDSSHRGAAGETNERERKPRSEDAVGVAKPQQQPMRPGSVTRTPRSTTHKDGETYYKTQLEVINKEHKLLQERLDVLEKENRDLKKTVYELAIAARSKPAGSNMSTRPYQNVFAFDLDVALNNDGGDHDAEGGTSQHQGDGADVIHFSCKIDLAAHAGAVYAIAFSPCGRFLASGSFDKSVSVWSVEKPSGGPTTSLYAAHDANVVDVAWSPDSTLLFSGGYDRCVKEWDLVGMRDTPLSSYMCPGLVQTLAVSSTDDVLYAGTTADCIVCFDRRAPSGDDEASAVIQNDSMVNTVCLSNDGNTLTSGDRRGMIKTWDVRKVGSEPVTATANSPEQRPISHIHPNAPFNGEDEGRLLAVNSYDNYLRVYDRGERLLGASPSALRPLHILRGHRNRNWPIRSAFFCGRDYRPWHLATSGVFNAPARGEADEFEFTAEDELVNFRTNGGISESLLLATGSADGNVYLFDVGDGPGAAKTVQVLTGHEDRCYATAFHPSEPLLASCSADSLVKLWTPSKVVNPAN